jgi:CHAT domain-containing protein/tetratricopeptide (TPR) repeat protein
MMNERQAALRPDGRSIRPFAFVWFLALLFLLPLRDSRGNNAQAAYDHALSLFERGFLAMSQEESASEFQQYRDSDPMWASRFQLLEANSMLFRGMYVDALGVLSSYSASNASNGTVEKLAIEAVALTRQQQTAAAGDRLARAEAICLHSDFPACGDEFAARAILSVKLGRMDEARETFLGALAFARTHNNEWLQASTFVNLGWVALQVDHFDEAVDWSRRAYETAEARGYENLAQAAEGNLGWAYFQLGDDERALEQFLTAESSATRLGNVRSELKWLTTAGYVYLDSGDGDRAARSYRQALHLAQQIQSREDIVNALDDLARVSVLNGKLDEADAAIAQLQLMNEDAGHPSATLSLAMGMLAAARGKSAQAEAYFHAVQADSSSLMTTKLGAGLELARLFESQDNLSAAERTYKATLSQYEAARAQLESEESELPFGANAAEIYDSYVHFLVKLGRNDAALAVADQSRAQTLERGLEEPGASKPLRTASFNPQQIARKTSSTLLFYWLGEQESYLWVITPAKTQLIHLPPQHEITKSVERYRKALLEVQDPLESGNADGQSLYKILVSSAAPLLRPNTRVIILADGILSQMNFETLLVPGAASGTPSDLTSNFKTHYLLGDLILSSAPSLAMLGAAEPLSRANRKILLIGNPISPDQDYPSLPFFGLEMSRIEGHFSSSETSAFTGQQATPAAYFASDPRSYTYIHFVSHAVASLTSPLDSAIILSNSTGNEDSYKLYAREIIQRPIHAQLVTISACYGSGTRTYAGEGLVGLSWAFLNAGAQRVIGALWEVSDDSTPRLMDKLYQGLTAGDPPAVALRNAKLSLLHSRSKFSVPFYWAPFQLYVRR